MVVVDDIEPVAPVVPAAPVVSVVVPVAPIEPVAAASAGGVVTVVLAVVSVAGAVAEASAAVPVAAGVSSCFCWQADSVRAAAAAMARVEIERSFIGWLPWGSIPPTDSHYTTSCVRKIVIVHLARIFVAEAVDFRKGLV